ncbi:V-type proton ATPase subunit Vha13 [Ptiloglossa arizonensis]|uniref:V-type proton ATPase subunit Vha13 n=1 Tax=Ptiloglossa arizonensis TaxID=3350558 RepID=UPI003F9F397A
MVGTFVIVRVSAHVRAQGKAPSFKAGQTTETPKSYDRFVILSFRIQISSFVTKMASQTQGIQQLLTAEKRAADKVADARKRKARRLKQAKEEAQDEIEKYRQERERQFREFEAKHMGSKEDVATRIEADTKIKIEEMNRDVSMHKKNVMLKILELVYNIKPQLHKNYRTEI